MIGAANPGLSGGAAVSATAPTSRPSRGNHAASVATLVKAQGWAAFRRHRRAVAAVEFALIAPVLALVLVGAADYGFAEYSRSCLANAVAQGAYYAFLTGPTVSTATIQSLVQNASSLTGVSVPQPAAAACYCPSGRPSALGSAVSCTPTTCTVNGTSTAPGTYITISATYRLAPWIPIPYYSGLSDQTITETVTVRLQ